MRRWLTGLLLFLLPGLVLAQTIEHTTVVRDYLNGLYVRGVPIGGAGASGADQVFLSTGPGAGVWRTVPSNCPLELDPVTHAFVCATGAVGATLGTVGTLQAANGTGGFAAFGGSACPIAGTFTTGMTPTGAQICGAPAVPPLTAHPLLTQASSEFPAGVNLGVQNPGVLKTTVTGGVATVTTVPAPLGDLVGTLGPQTVLNTFVAPRVHPLADPLTTGGIINPMPRDYDLEYAPAVSQAFTVANPIGGVQGQWYRLSFQSLAPQGITWGTQYNANAGMPLPTTTTGANVRDVFLLDYDPTTGQWQMLYNSQLFAQFAGALGGGSGTATAAGVFKDIQFHDAGTGLGADTGRYVYDPAAHRAYMQEAVTGAGAGVVTLPHPNGYKTFLVAGALTKDRANTLPDADGPLCTATTCGGSTTVTGTIGDVVSIGASNLPTDSGVLAANLVTATANHVSGNLVQGAGANKTTSDAGIATTNVVTAAAAYTSGNLVQAAGANKTTSDSGIATNTVVTLAGTQTLTNKLIIPPVTPLTTSSTSYTFAPAITASEYEVQLTGGAGAITVSAPSGGTPANNQRFWYRFLCTSLNSITWNSIYISSPNIALPTACPANVAQWMAVGFVYSTVLGKAQLYAVN